MAELKTQLLTEHKPEGISSSTLKNALEDCLHFSAIGFEWDDRESKKREISLIRPLVYSSALWQDEEDANKPHDYPRTRGENWEKYDRWGDGQATAEETLSLAGCLRNYFNYCELRALAFGLHGEEKPTPEQEKEIQARRREGDYIPALAHILTNYSKNKEKIKESEEFAEVCKDAEKTLADCERTLKLAELFTPNTKANGKPFQSIKKTFTHNTYGTDEKKSFMPHDFPTIEEYDKAYQEEERRHGATILEDVARGYSSSIYTRKDYDGNPTREKVFSIWTIKNLTPNRYGSYDYNTDREARLTLYGDTTEELLASLTEELDKVREKRDNAKEDLQTLKKIYKRYLKKCQAINQARAKENEELAEITKGLHNIPRELKEQGARAK